MNSRCALISGANRGIGAAISERLVAEGWNVSLGMRRPELPEWASQVNAAKIHLAEYDATNKESEARWVGDVEKHFGRIDAVIANAGVMIPKDVIEADEDDLRLMFDVNTFAPRRLAKAAWHSLGKSGQGRIIILSSLSGKRVKSAGASSYAMSKHAALALAHALRHTGFDQGIRATAVCPGFVATDMGMAVTDRAADTMTDPADLARIVAMLIDLPNTASVAEFCINCQPEGIF